MTKLNLQKYRKALEQKECEVRRMMKPDHLAAGSEDDRILAGERSIGLLIADRDLQILEEIHSALARMGQDEYGLCQICEDPINPKRLDATLGRAAASGARKPPIGERALPSTRAAANVRPERFCNVKGR